MSTSPSAPLPPSREFMTSLFNSLTSPTSSSTSPIQSLNTDTNTYSNTHTHTTSTSISHTQRFSKENERDNGNGNQSQNQNPLKQIDAQKKALLMTLHVIFPPPLLLHALDLLDRGGVGRLVLKGEGDAGERVSTGEDLGSRKDGEGRGMGRDLSGEAEKEVESSRDMEVENTGVGETTTNACKPKISPSISISISAPPNPPSPPTTKPTTCYQVRSSQPSKWHSHSSRSVSTSGTGAGHAAAENTYTVHLDAWNCSCAAFAFSSFPASSSSSSSFSPSHPHPHQYISPSPSSTSYFPWGVETSPDEGYSIPVSISEGKEKGKEEEEKWRYGGWSKTSQVPICKHLLACLLVERWGDVLGTYVRERVVGREEMGGLVV